MSDVLVEMVDGGLGHVPVLDAVGDVAGIFAETDLLALNRVDPTGVRTRLAEANAPREVAAAMQAISDVAVTLHDAGLETIDVARVTTSLVDASARRLLELAMTENGEPPVAWAWLALGSAARRELALSADQDHTLVWDGGPEHDDYFGRIAEFVTAGLEAGGLSRCSSNVMATVPGWRCGLEAWLERQRTWIERSTGEIDLPCHDRLRCSAGLGPARCRRACSGSDRRCPRVPSVPASPRRAGHRDEATARVPRQPRRSA